MKDVISIKGAREHNLKNISLEFPKNKMVVFTGVSGSGKSSLAFDTIFAEGQRRYVESLSAYARQFLGKMDKPDVDEVTGLSPAISIDQKSHSSNPRSTVATITEIYDYLRVLFARAGTPHCPICGKKLQKMSVDEIVDAAVAFARTLKGESLYVLSPVVRGRKGEYYQMLYDFLSAGFVEARIDGKVRFLRDRITLERYKRHTIELVVDKLPFGVNFTDKDNRLRLAEGVEMALKHSSGLVMLRAGEREVVFSTELMCSEDNVAFPEIEPRLFSFNSPYGACETCHGLGTDGFYSEAPCPVCRGKRLRPEALSVLVDGKNITQITALPVSDAQRFCEDLKQNADERTAEIASAPLREIQNRLQFLLDVGLNYITLDREAGTLSGGEAQRIRLASQIGSGLTGTLYVLDEPTIGLHQRDNEKLIQTLHRLRDLGNTVIVVEHDAETILRSDYLIDVGPGPGVRGGEIVAQGTLPGILKDARAQSLTLEYLRGTRRIPVPERRSSRAHYALKITGASEHNLQNVNVSIPLGRLVVLTGVSGSGKSTLMNDVLYKALANKLNGADYRAGAHTSLSGADAINRVADIDQSPIGRTPRSNPATYVGAWNYIRDLFAATEEARVRGYKIGRFSFNVPGGRCEKCEGHGYLPIEMHFLPTVYVTCDVCKGKRYNRETLEVTYRDKTVYDVLHMTVEECLAFFGDIPWLKERLKVLCDVGLGYLELGQPAPTLSGGEAQRVKLAKELGKPDTHRTLYLLDEPTTGLHFDDVAKLVEVLQLLVNRGNTVLVIEHNLDVIKSADWVIDLGPGGGDEGGRVVAAGTPETVARKAGSATGEYLRKVLREQTNHS